MFVYLSVHLFLNLFVYLFILSLHYLFLPICRYKLYISYVIGVLIYVSMYIERERERERGVCVYGWEGGPNSPAFVNPMILTYHFMVRSCDVATYNFPLTMLQLRRCPVDLSGCTGSTNVCTSRQCVCVCACMHACVRV